MKPDATYTGIRAEHYYDQHYKGFPTPTPPPLPPLIPINQVIGVTMDSTARLPSTWRTGSGKYLTNKRIAELQREGYYGSGLKLPPLEQAQKCFCGSVVNTRVCNWGWLRKKGVWCKKCLVVLRARRDKEVEAEKNERKLFMEEYQ